MAYLVNKIKKDIEELEHVRKVRNYSVFFDIDESVSDKEKKKRVKYVNDKIIEVIDKYAKNQNVYIIENGWKEQFIYPAKTGIFLVNYFERYGEGRVDIEKIIRIDDDKHITIGLTCEVFFISSNLEYTIIAVTKKVNSTTEKILKTIEELKKYNDKSNNVIVKYILDLYIKNSKNIKILKKNINKIKEILIIN